MGLYKPGQGAHQNNSMAAIWPLLWCLQISVAGALKIHILDIPARYNQELLEENKAHQDTEKQLLNHESHFAQFASEVVIHENFRSPMYSWLLASDPAAADFFFVPYYAGLAGMMERASDLDREMLSLLHSNQWWQRNKGSDFIYVLSFPPPYGLGIIPKEA